MSAPLRVAAVMDTVQVSGPGRQLAALAGALRDEGVELRVFAFRRTGRDRYPYATYLAERGIGCVELPESGPADRTLPGRLRAALEEWRPDVVQTHGYRATTLVWWLRRAGARWPWVGVFHGATTENVKVRIYHTLDLSLLRAADRVVVMSERQRARMRRLGARVRVIANAVLPAPGVAPDAEESARLQAADVLPRPRLGVIARLSPEKGVDVFLRAAALLRSRGVPFSAVVAGDGQERDALHALRDELGLRDLVLFAGHLRAVEALYPRLDAIVLPSRSEGLPNVLLEAMRHDLPAVATDVGAVPEVVAGTAAAVVVPPGSPEALAGGIERALREGGSAEAAAARRATAERFSLERRVAAHLQLYRELVPDARPALATTA